MMGVGASLPRLGKSINNFFRASSQNPDSAGVAARGYVGGRQNIGSKRVTGKILQDKELEAADPGCGSNAAWVSSRSRNKEHGPNCALSVSSVKVARHTETSFFG